MVGPVTFDAGVRPLKRLHHMDRDIRILSPIDPIEVSSPVPGAPLGAFALEHIGH